MTPNQRELASLIICDHIVASPWFRQSTSIGCYLPAHDEVATWSLIERALERKKRVFVPAIAKNGKMKFVSFDDQSSLRRNTFGLFEPAAGSPLAAKNLDVVVTPVVAFDEKGNRIGMGGGYFDRAFAFLRHRKHFVRPKLLGAAFDCQKVTQIAANPWDIPLLAVFTESGRTIDTAP